MIGFIEYLNIPSKIALILVGVFFVFQVVGEILEFKGKAVPEFLKMRKYFARKKKERQALEKMTTLLDEYSDMSKTISDVNRLLTDIDVHYSKDNIAMRDGWMKKVNDHIAESEERRRKQDELIKALGDKLDQNNADTLSLLIENKRSAIIDFASKVIDEKYPVTREQFKRIFKIHKEYEEIIKNNDMTNGEVDIAFRIINESYEIHMRNHTFIEDIRGYK